MKNYCIIIFLLILSTEVSSQDLSTFKGKENYGISGNITLGTNFYNAISGPQRFAPFGFNLQGGLNVQLGAINVPISASYYNLQGSISSPFQLYGASPYYKWVKLHLGYRTLNFSPYVYSGRAFNGVGIELTPGAFQLTAFRGSLQNLLAIRDTVIDGALVLPSYERKITGVKIGFGKRATKIELMGTKIADDGAENNIYISPPQENLVLGVQGKIQLLKSINLTANVATSIFTGDKNASIPDEIDSRISTFNSFQTLNATSRLSFAGDASLSYSNKGYNIGFKYKRIDPYYYSLATNFIQNDIENYTIEGGIPLLRKKLRIRGSLGIQRDNLYDTKAFTSNRLISSATATYLPNKDLNLMFRYSNYQHESTSGLVAVNDTLRILTTTNTLMFNGVYQFLKTGTWQYGVNLNIFKNDVVDESQVSANGFSGLGVTISFPIRYDEKQWTISPSLFYNQYDYSTSSQGRVGTGLTVAKTLLDKKLKTSITTMISQNQLDKKSNGNLFNLSSNITYNISKKQSLSLRLYYYNSGTIVGNGINEVRGSLGYGYRF